MPPPSSVPVAQWELAVHVIHVCMLRSAAPSLRLRGVVDNAMRAQLAYICRSNSASHRIMIDRQHGHKTTDTDTNWDTHTQTWSTRAHSLSLEGAKRDAVRRDLPVGTRRLTLAGSYSLACLAYCGESFDRARADRPPSSSAAKRKHPFFAVITLIAEMSR